MLLSNHQDLQKLSQILQQLTLVNDFIANWKKAPFDFKEKQLSDKVLVRLLTYQTGDFQDRNWEAHKREIDLHVILEGEEQIYFAGSESLVPGDYHQEEDYYPLTGNSQNFVLLSADQELSPNDSLIIWLDEAHKTGVSANSTTVKKLVFKILI